MELGNQQITSDIAGVIDSTIGMGFSTERLGELIGVLVLFTLFLWAAWYLKRVFATGDEKGDYKFILTGFLYVFAVVGALTWIINRIF